MSVFKEISPVVEQKTGLKIKSFTESVAEIDNKIMASGMYTFVNYEKMFSVGDLFEKEKYSELTEDDLIKHFTEMLK